MTMTVKKLIQELESIQNKFLEVEVSFEFKNYEIYFIGINKTKVIIRVKDDK